MKPRQQRMLAVGLVSVGVIISAFFAKQAFDDNMMFFVDVSRVVAGDYPEERNFRIGGLVVAGSIERREGSLDMRFRVSDTKCELNVRYSGVLPDLFREGQGVVAHGHMGAEGDFIADKILAKHDEEYMAPEVAESLAKHASDKMASAQSSTEGCNAE